MFVDGASDTRNDGDEWVDISSLCSQCLNVWVVFVEFFIVVAIGNTIWQ